MSPKKRYLEKEKKMEEYRLRRLLKIEHAKEAEKERQTKEDAMEEILIGKAKLAMQRTVRTGKSRTPFIDFCTTYALVVMSSLSLSILLALSTSYCCQAIFRSEICHKFLRGGPNERRMVSLRYWSSEVFTAFCTQQLQHGPSEVWARRATHFAFRSYLIHPVC
jgi:hypothetical protein